MAFEKIRQSLAVIGQGTKSGVQKVSDGVSINNRIQAEKRSLERLLAVIGEQVYKEDPDTPIPGLEDEYEAVKVAYANLKSYEEQLNQAKGIIYRPLCRKAAAKGDKYCEKCGTCLIPGEESKGRRA